MCVCTQRFHPSGLTNSNSNHRLTPIKHWTLSINHLPMPIKNRNLYEHSNARTWDTHRSSQRLAAHALRRTISKLCSKRLHVPRSANGNLYVKSEVKRSIGWWKCTIWIWLYVCVLGAMNDFVSTMLSGCLLSLYLGRVLWYTTTTGCYTVLFDLDVIGKLNIFKESDRRQFHVDWFVNVHAVISLGTTNGASIWSPYLMMNQLINYWTSKIITKWRYTQHHLVKVKLSEEGQIQIFSKMWRFWIFRSESNKNRQFNVWTELKVHLNGECFVRWFLTAIFSFTIFS